MTAAQLRQSFLDFFAEKNHTLVPSASLMPDSPNLLFTNAGMNQFVPIFLGKTQCPYTPGRAADTQKCIRAGGKHNDLDDVGLDTYHHTFFEMLGNWSFGDYFKKDAIEWAWELIVDVWDFPPERLYATVYNPDKAKGDPADFDADAWNFWAAKFEAQGLDPAIHIVNGNKKDNFWMMGDTGPCGPCSELHVDLTPTGHTRGSLVNMGDSRCIEIWNLVFIQFNANPDGTFVPLPSQHVDTGMGFERVASIIQGTKNFTDFEHARISNYDTDIFRPIFDELEKMSGKTYRSTLPGSTVAPAPASRGESNPFGVDSFLQNEPISVGKIPFSEGRAATAGGSGATFASDHPTADISDATAGGGGATIAGDRPTTDIRDTTTDIRDSIAGVKDFTADVSDSTADANDSTVGIKEPVFEGKESIFAVPKMTGEASAAAPATPAAPSVLPSDDLGEPDPIPDLASPTSPIPGVIPESGPINLAPHEIATDLPASGESPTTLPAKPLAGPYDRYATPEQIALDIAFRVIADHIRTLSFAIADGINPGNTDRNYVLRRILRRAVRYGRTLGFTEPFFYKLVDVLARTMGAPFPELRTRQKNIEEVLKREEEAFNKTLDRGIELFDAVANFQIVQQAQFKDVMLVELEDMKVHALQAAVLSIGNAIRPNFRETLSSEEHTVSHVRNQLAHEELLPEVSSAQLEEAMPHLLACAASLIARGPVVSGKAAFLLYDTYGFPLDLTELMARERGIPVDVEGFNTLMGEQRARARAAQKKEVIALSEIETTEPTRFVGYDRLEGQAEVAEVIGVKGKTAVIVPESTFYAEMGGQVGDTGELASGGQVWTVTGTQKAGKTWLHFIEAQMGDEAPAVGATVTLAVDRTRRLAIERHHTVTHLLHWALHEVVGKEATQKGSFVGPEKLTFDFNSPALTAAQVRAVERMVNERIQDNAPVSGKEVPYAEVKSRADVMQFFGDKYGDTVRVVQIGGAPGALDGFSMELCGGTHTRATGEIGGFRIVSEGAVAAGVRRIEAVAGSAAYDASQHDAERLRALAARLGTPVGELERKVDAMFTRQDELEKQVALFHRKQAAHVAAALTEKIQKLIAAPAILEPVPGATADELAAIAEALRTQFNGIVVLAGAVPGAVALMVTVSPQFTDKFSAGKIMQAIAPLVGGKGGGKPDAARGAGKDPGKIPQALAAAKALLKE